MDSIDVYPRSDEDRFLSVPYESRWEPLKRVIVELYMGKYGPEGKSMTMREVAEFMKDNYSFYAAETQYKRKFRPWCIRKRTLATEKNDIVSVLGKRARPGMSTSDVTLSQGGLAKSVDSKQLKRHVHSQIRHYKVEPLVPGVFTTFNMPYQAYIAASNQNSNLPSPGFVNVHSPGPVTALSPTMHLVNQKAVWDRANLLLKGDFKTLFARCGDEDRM
ncbi:hypothetical protein CMQ_7227 [Grosmannia clavigera kw1407]|uniref:Clr5 domain-containing protein n=1 Tax=Grosmannia clavigera (strain kw1407 / UAMH 11150) TaxID=655863 RepID=F0XPA1_GROCL|nr:uncharacterized protein CMQ_7227 [Grosmannia clavigera kw1407]EFX00225.1 hypothetical protein CMQ_7227 [Grosmannia clavigera kw1407]